MAPTSTSLPDLMAAASRQANGAKPVATPVADPTPDDVVAALELAGSPRTVAELADALDVPNRTYLMLGLVQSLLDDGRVAAETDAVGRRRYALVPAVAPTPEPAAAPIAGSTTAVAPEVPVVAPPPPPPVRNTRGPDRRPRTRHSPLTVEARATSLLRQLRAHAGEWFSSSKLHKRYGGGWQQVNDALAQLHAAGLVRRREQTRASTGIRYYEYTAVIGAKPGQEVPERAGWHEAAAEYHAAIIDFLGARPGYHPTRRIACGIRRDSERVGSVLADMLRHNEVEAVYTKGGYPRYRLSAAGTTAAAGRAMTVQTMAAVATIDSRAVSLAAVELLGACFFSIDEAGVGHIWKDPYGDPGFAKAKRPVALSQVILHGPGAQAEAAPAGE